MKILLSCVIITAAVQSTAGVDETALSEEIIEHCSGFDLEGIVAWVRELDGDTEIFIMDLSVGVPDRVTYNMCDDWSPALSPDGCYLAWVSEMSGQADIHLMDLSRSGHQRTWDLVTETPGVEDHLSWSADGRRLYFSSMQAPKGGYQALPDPG